MRFAGQFWVVDEPVAPSDALIVLGDDNYAADRAFHAAELYREGVAPVVVASGRMLRQNVSIAEVMEHDLESFGIPASSIVKLSHRAENTQEEAVEAARPDPRARMEARPDRDLQLSCPPRALHLWKDPSLERHFPRQRSPRFRI